MLTCEQVLDEAKRLRQMFQVDINQNNYLYIATCIHPLTRLPFIGSTALVDQMQAELLEMVEVKRARRINTDDWTDLVLALVVSWQCNVAVANWLKAHGHPVEFRKEGM